MKTKGVFVLFEDGNVSALSQGFRSVVKESGCGSFVVESGDVLSQALCPSGVSQSLSSRFRRIQSRIVILSHDAPDASLQRCMSLFDSCEVTSSVDGFLMELSQHAALQESPAASSNDLMFVYVAKNMFNTIVSRLDAVSDVIHRSSCTRNSVLSVIANISSDQMELGSAVLEVFEKCASSTLCPFRPRQSWQLVDSTVDKTRIGTFIISGRNWVRVDECDSLSVKDCVARGAYPPHALRFLLPELVYKMGFADKYGA
eukprot:ANDGO_00906.mRNA.1 hypothetical protein